MICEKQLLTATDCYTVFLASSVGKISIAGDGMASSSILARTLRPWRRIRCAFNLLGKLILAPGLEQHWHPNQFYNYNSIFCHCELCDAKHRKARQSIWSARNSFCRWICIAEQMIQSIFCSQWQHLKPKANGSEVKTFEGAAVLFYN